MKNMLLVLVIVAFCFGLAQAQDTSSPTFKQHSVGINHSYDATSMLSTDDYYYFEYFKKGSHRVAYGYSAAALYQYRPVKWFSVEAGIEYNSTKTRVVDGFPFDAIFHQAFDPAPSLFEMEFNRSISRFGVPINLRWHYQKNRWGFYGLAGVVFTTNHMRNYSFDEYYLEGEKLNYIEEHSFKDNFGMGLTAGLGVEYSITPHWLLRMEPRFRIYNVAKSTPIGYFYQSPPQNHYWAAGLNLGVYYGFGKY